MVKIDEARTYVAGNVLVREQIDLLDRFFDNFETGAYVVLGPDDEFGSADYFRRSTDKLSYIFVYRFVDPDRIGLRAAYTGFQGHQPELGDLIKLTTHILLYKSQYDEFRPQGRQVLATITEPGRPVDGAYLVVRHEHEKKSELYGYHVTRPYLTGPQSRHLLYTAVAKTLIQAFK